MAAATRTASPARTSREVARLLCVVDCYDAMSSERPYRRALSYRQCLAELRRLRRLPVRPGAWSRRSSRPCAVCDDDARRWTSSPRGPRPASTPPLTSCCARAPTRRVRSTGPWWPRCATSATRTRRCASSRASPSADEQLHLRPRHRRGRERGLARRRPVAGAGRAGGRARRRQEHGQRAQRRRLRRVGDRHGAALRRRRHGARRGHRGRAGARVGALPPERPVAHPRGHPPGGDHPLQPGRGRGDHRRPHGPLQPPLPARAARRGARPRPPLRRRGQPAVHRLRRVQAVQRRLRAQARRRGPRAHRPHPGVVQPARRPRGPLRRRGVRAGPGRHRRRRRAHGRGAHPRGGQDYGPRRRAAARPSASASPRIRTDAAARTNCSTRPTGRCTRPSGAAAIACCRSATSSSRGTGRRAAAAAPRHRLAAATETRRSTPRSWRGPPRRPGPTNRAPAALPPVPPRTETRRRDAGEGGRLD